MKLEQYQEIKQYVPAVDQYSKEVELIESFFAEKDLEIQKTDAVFWNHLITLFERIDKGEQNTDEIDASIDEMSAEAQELTTDFVTYMNAHRPFPISQFEHFLLTIYFEQLKNKKDKKENEK